MWTDPYEAVRAAIAAGVAGCTARNQCCGAEPIDVVQDAASETGETVIWGYRASDGTLYSSPDELRRV